MSDLTPRLQLLAAAALFSTGGAVIKAIELTSWQVASARSAVAFVVLTLLVPACRQLRDRRVWLVGAAYAATMILFVLANKLTTAANTIFLQATAPLYLVILAPIVLRERVTRRDFLFMAALGGGVACFFLGRQDPTITAPDPATGNVLGAVSGLSWALTILGLRWLGRTDEGGPTPSAAVAAGNALACLVALPMALPMPPQTGVDVAGVLFLGALQIGLAYVLLIGGIRRVGAMEASLLLLTEPLLNPLWSWLAHRETPDRLSLVGCAIILVATVAHTLLARRQG